MLGYAIYHNLFDQFHVFLSQVVADAIWLMPLVRRMTLLAKSEGKTLPIDTRSLWPGLAASLGFRPEDGIGSVVVVREGSGTPRRWPSSERSMIHGIFLRILCTNEDETICTYKLSLETF